MKFTDVKSGAVFQVPLFKEYGFGYVLLKFIDICNGRQETLVQPLNLFSKEKNNSSDKAMEAEFMFTPTLMMGSPKIRGKESWKFVGYKEINENDFSDVEFKVCYQLGHIKPEADLSKLNWYRVSEFGLKESGKEDFEKIKHLGFYAELNYRLVTLKLTLEWIIKNGDNVKEVFGEEDFRNTLGLSMVYAHVLSCVPN